MPSLVRLAALFTALGLAALPAGGQAPEVLALADARLLPVASAPLERGTLLIAGGKIADLGADIPLPAGSRRLDLTGKVVIPGLVDAHSALLLSQADLNAAGAADRSVLDAADFFDRNAERALARGVTTAYLSPGRRGNVNGLGAVVKLVGLSGEHNLQAEVIERRAAVKLAFGGPPGERSASLERLASYEALRSALRGAEQYLRSFERYERQLALFERRAGPGQGERGRQRPEEPDRNPAQEALAAALRGELAVRVEAHRVDEILNALRLKDEFGIRLVLERATAGAAVAPEIARRGVPVVWGPTLLPGAPDLDTADHAPENAAALAEAGVRLALVTGGEDGLASRFLLENAAAAAGFGLAPETALRAVTLDAAQVLGVANRLGSLRIGNDADLVILDALPWEPQARVLRVYVNGRLSYDAW